MALYNKEQLVVMYCIALLLLGSAVWRLVPAAVPESRPAARQPFVYELAGDVPAPGMYCFAGPQTLERLLAAAGAAAFDGQPAPAVASGSRIVVAGGRPAIEAMRPQDRVNCFVPIALSTATAEDLALIPGMGEKTAAAIIDYRDARGGIKDLAQLEAVEGMGPKKLARFAPFLTVGN